MTGQATWTALAFVAGFVPRGLLVPVGGALADRLDRRRGLVVGNLVDAALAVLLALAVATGRGSPALVTAVTFVSGCVGALRMPFHQAMLPDLVPRDDLLGAVSLGWAQWNLGRVIGPALAGLVVAFGSFALAFALNAASFLVVVAALLAIRVPAPRSPGDQETGILDQIRAGARAVAAEPACRAAVVLVGAAAFLVAPFMALIPAVASVLVGGGAEAIARATGALTTAQGVGSVVTALALAPLAERFGRRRLLMAGLVATPLLVVPYALSGTVPVAFAALVLVGGAYTGILSALGTVMQLRAPAAVRGRALSLFHATLTTAFPLGSLAQGVAADRVGLRPAAIGAAALFLVVVGGLRVLRPRLIEALDGDGMAGEETAAELETAAERPEEGLAGTRGGASY
jgi:MFS family permease